MYIFYAMVSATSGILHLLTWMIVSGSEIQGLHFWTKAPECWLECLNQIKRRLQIQNADQQACKSNCCSSF